MFAFLGVLSIALVTSAPVDHPDRVISLPGAPLEPNFPLYSGFLNVTDNSTQHSIFYILCESIRANPLEAPLIVWFNGGPGASSLMGFLLEHGPYVIDAQTRQLGYNDFSWNQYANVLYIESPSGVGFSHSNESQHGFHDDVSTGRTNRKALQDFMTRVHPRYSTRDFFLAGESYAGVYIPYLTTEILIHQHLGEFTNENFKGIAMGNAAVDNFSNLVASLLQMYSLGMIPEKYGKVLFDLWERILKGDHVSYSEFAEAYQYTNHLERSSFYNLPLECNRNEDEKLWHITKQVDNVECEVENLTEMYMNRDDVQYALHVHTRAQAAVRWTMMNNRVYHKYRQDTDTIPIYRDIVAKAPPGFRILFYTGDLDLVCPPLQVAFGARRIAEQNGMTDVTGSSEWRYLSDFGGARTSYSTGDHGISMDVITVRGAGHMVPINLPDRAFQIINNFITADPTGSVDYSKMIPRK